MTLKPNRVINFPVQLVPCINRNNGILWTRCALERFFRIEIKPAVTHFWHRVWVNNKRIFQVLVMALSFVLAVGANLGIGACVLRYKEMRTPTNLCLVNLAAADLLFALGVPAVAYTRLTQSWRLGEAVCRMLPYSQVSLFFIFRVNMILIQYSSIF